MSGTKLILILGMGFMLLAAPSAAALPIDATETADFGNTNTGSTDLGSFEIGINHVRGSVDRPAGDPFDFWHADVPTGLQILSVAINVTGSSGAPWRAIVEDRFISTSVDTVYAAWLTTSGDGDFDMPVTKGALPFPAGSYYFGNVTFLESTTAYEYEWVVEVVPVPEPGTAMLMGLGLAGLGSLRQRQH